jgi:hypothetical protein
VVGVGFTEITGVGKGRQRVSKKRGPRWRYVVSAILWIMVIFDQIGYFISAIIYKKNCPFINEVVPVDRSVRTSVFFSGLSSFPGPLALVQRSSKALRCNKAKAFIYLQLPPST